MAYVWIALGSALGGMARHAVGGWALNVWGPAFPWGTLIVNILGSLMIGVIATTVQGNEQTRLFLAVGLCGGFTTFSAFSLQTLNLLQGGAYSAAASNIGLSVVVCILAVWAGAHMGNLISR
jgi:fluoride exporter